jgi:hypothetical protein
MMRRAALVFVFAWFALGGLAHFVFTHAEMRIVPPGIAWPRAAVLVSGAFAGGARRARSEYSIQVDGDKMAACHEPAPSP